MYAECTNLSNVTLKCFSRKSCVLARHLENGCQPFDGVQQPISLKTQIFQLPKASMHLSLGCVVGRLIVDRSLP
jgi:hypothetical protein